ASLQSANDDGGGLAALVTDVAQPRGMAVDSVNRFAYWTELGDPAIHRVSLDGSGTDEFVVDVRNGAAGIAFDLGAEKLYWSDSEGAEIDAGIRGGKIRRANLDGSQPEDVVATDLLHPAGIAVDSIGSKVYWSDVEGHLDGSGRILRANLDGSDVETLLTGIDEATGLAIDQRARKLYWADSATGRVQRANLDGSGLETVLEVPATTVAMNIETGTLYWTEGSGNVKRARLDGTDPFTIAAGVGEPWGIGVLPPHYFSWDLNGDGDFGDALGETPFLSWEQLAAFGINDDGEFAVRLRVTDAFGLSSVAETTLTVANAAPSNLQLDPLEAYLEGSEVTLVGHFDDAGQGDSHTVSIDWGDGQTANFPLALGARDFAAAHRYLDNSPAGYFTAQVTVRDDDGGETAASQDIFISNADPTIVDFTATPNAVDEGSAVTVTGRIADPSLDLLNGLTARYDFSGDAADLSGFGNDGTVFGPVPTADRFGISDAAFLFDGDDDYIQLPEGSAFDSTDYSISLWFRAESTPAQAGMLISKGQNNFEIHTAGDTGATAMTFLPRFGSGQDWHTESDAYALHEWTHVVAVYRSAAEVRFYVNGTEAPLFGPNVAENAPDNLLNARLGMRTDNALAFHGAIDDVRIYSRALSMSEAAELFALVPSADTHGVMIDWGDGTSSDAAVDAVAHTFTATHTYLDDDPSGTPADVYTISATVNDDDGGSGAAETEVTVANVAPTVAITAIPIVVNIGQPFTLQALADDPGTLEAIAFQWQVTRNGQTVATGAGDLFAFTPLEVGEHLFTLTGTDDDGGVGTAQIALEAGPCRVPGDTNHDCRVDVVDLNNVRNHFGETGLGVVDLSFNAPSPGTLLDKDGVGVGFTHRLPGTGDGLPSTDPNMDLEPGINGRLLLRSTMANANSDVGVNLEILEAPGVLLPGIGQDDFNLTATFLDVQVPNSGDNLTLYAGTAWNNTVRVGFHESNVYHIAINRGFGDEILYSTAVNAFAPGDDVTLTLSRRMGNWSASWLNHTIAAASGESPTIELPWLNAASDLYLGVQHASPTTVVQQTATIDSFTLDILRPIPGDSNADFIVNLIDLNAVRNNFGTSFPAPQASGTAGEAIARRVRNLERPASFELIDAVFARFVRQSDWGPFEFKRTHRKVRETGWH
ncbi:MAG: LamG-like jellyroll fold domain-containing protein, partial [Planctomycetia bacterium]|nr:LamG-like jellyroll fold domain-containing protein [Planctomycetia bacterium]